MSRKNTQQFHTWGIVPDFMTKNIVLQNDQKWTRKNLGDFIQKTTSREITKIIPHYYGE